MKKLTYRGKLADGEEQRIRLSRKDGLMGYKVVKFDIIPARPGTDEIEATVSISKYSFTPASDINLDNHNILAVAYWSGYYTSAYPQVNTKIIIDTSVVNQDIFVGNKDRQGNAMNYYIELEEVKLDLNEATVATLKDMRGRE
jgi:hypothetical protein